MYSEPELTGATAEATIIVPAQLDDTRVFVAALDLDGSATDGREVDVAGVETSLTEVVAGIRTFANAVANELRESDVTKATIEFGCEIALQSGSFFAVLGKASNKSAFKVALEWSRADPLRVEVNGISGSKLAEA
ncbi:CU044_2847 family protein [Micromonospora sp. NPDC005197]|uniref:CU044_2847 family protein n=1 Tax=Micromonospora sp. NPDC005197 TaxID=3157020 RepID=UPI0033A1BF6B